MAITGEELNDCHNQGQEDEANGSFSIFQGPHGQAFETIEETQSKIDAYKSGQDNVEKNR